MEHRLKKRYSLFLNVIVRGHGGLMLHGTTRDLSLDGMFIQLGKQIILANKVVEVEFLHSGCLSGWVVHAGDQGIGVMFRSVDSHEKMLLDQLLSGELTDHRYSGEA